MKILDNFVNKNTSRYIKEMLLSEIFPWFYCDKIVSTEENSRSQFTHLFYREGEPVSSFYKNLIQTELISNLSIAALIKVKSNLQVKTDTIQKNNLHTDHKFPNALTAIYYVNSNNGYTFFENGKVVESKEGRVIIFPSNIKHSGTTCTDEKYRCVLNFNYYPQSL